MKAIVKTRQEAGAELLEIAIPEIKPDEALVKVKATSICGTDVHIHQWNAWAQARIKNIPQIMGHEFCGEIVEIGSEVKKLRAKRKEREIRMGDYVSAETHIFCGKCLQCKKGQRHLCSNLKILGVDCDGCFAEYIAIPEKILWKNDPNLSPEKACIQEPLGNAVYAVFADDKTIQGKNILIFGDGIGLFATGVARAEKAGMVILVGENDKCLEIGRQMGADFTIKYTPDKDIASELLNITGGVPLDIVLEMAGTKASIDLAFKLVRKGGRISAFGIPSEKITLDYVDDIVFKGVNICGISGRRIWQTWKKVAELLKSGRLDVSPVITHKLSLEEFEKGFDLMTTRPKVSGKVVLIP